MKDRKIEISRYTELSDKAYFENRYTFTDFLSLDELSDLMSVKTKLRNLSLSGGAPDTERVIARFGSEDDLGYEEDFPIVCISAKPNAPKFADKLNHRDYLGSIMNLGLERSCIGDIIVNEDSSAYIFVLDRIADYICDNLIKVKHTDVHCEATVLPEDTVLFRTEEKQINVASYRADCLISAVYNISRAKAEAYFDAEQVFVNGRICRKSDTPKDGDKISVRHLGKFRIKEQSGTSKKGRLFITIDKYI